MTESVRPLEQWEQPGLDCFQRALIFLYCKRLEKEGITAQIIVTKKSPDEL